MFRSMSPRAQWAALIICVSLFVLTALWGVGQEAQHRAVLESEARAAAAELAEG